MTLHHHQPPHSALSNRPGVDLHGSFDAMPVDYLKFIDEAGGTRQPRLGELSHVAFFGTNGSGKSTAMKLHMKSLLPAAKTHNRKTGQPIPSPFDLNFRAIVYDPKTDLIPFLSSLGFSQEKHIINTNIFDSRSVAWDVAKDINTFKRAETFANLLIKENKYEAPIWQNGVREIVMWTLVSLIRHGAHWTMRDFVEILSNKTHLRTVLGRHDFGKQVIAEYLDNESDGLRGGMPATLRSNVAPLRTAGTAWARATQSFSFRDWANGGGIILIGDDYLAEKQALLVNNLLIHYAIAAVLGRPDDIQHKTTLCYLDEIKRAGRFLNFGTMLTQGRSKGLHCILAAQGYTTFKAAFDENEIGEVLNNVPEKCIMQLTEPEDTDWAVRVFANTRRLRVTRTRQHGVNAAEGSTSSTWVEEPTLTARDIIGLKSAQMTARGLDAFVARPGDTSEHVTIDGNVVNARLAPLPNAIHGVDAIEHRDGDDFEPLPLTTPELRRLGLESADPPSTAPKSRFRLPPPPRTHV